MPRHEPHAAASTGILTAAQLDETVDAIAGVQLAGRQHPVDPGRPHRSVEPGRGRDGARPRRPPRRGRARLRVARSACRTPTARGTRTTSATTIKDPTLDTNVTCYVATGVWHHYLCTDDTAFLREHLADGRAHDRLRARRTRPRPARSRGAPTTRPTARCSPARRASTSACGARSPIAERLGHERPDWELSLGVARHRDRAPARALPRQGALGDGLVLPDPRRRAARPGRAAAHRRTTGTRSSSRAAACAASRTSRGSPRPRRASS